MLEKIVVGYAGDQAGRDAVRLAGVLAAASGGRLTVAFPYHPLLATRDAEEVQKAIAQEVQALLDDVKAARLSVDAAGHGVDGTGLSVEDTGLSVDAAGLSVEDTGLSVDAAGHGVGDTGLSVEGASALEQPTFHWTPSPWPIHALHELAAYEGADLIVLGAAKQGIADHLHVSLMERMVHSAPCAVAIAPPEYDRRPLLRIGVGFAASDEGSAAVGLASKLAARTGGSVRLIAAAGLEPALAGYAFSSPALVDVEEEIYEETVQALERFCSELPDAAPPQREVIRGEPPSVLLASSSELDLLVLGSRAYGPLRHVLLGSVSARVMREARCPVLVVPRGVPRGDGAPGVVRGDARHGEASTGAQRQTARGDERDREQRAGAAHHG